MKRKLAEKLYKVREAKRRHSLALYRLESAKKYVSQEHKLDEKLDALKWVQYCQRKVAEADHKLSVATDRLLPNGLQPRRLDMNAPQGDNVQNQGDNGQDQGDNGHDRQDQIAPNQM